MTGQSCPVNTQFWPDCWSTGCYFEHNWLFAHVWLEIILRSAVHSGIFSHISLVYELVKPLVSEFNTHLSKIDCQYIVGHTPSKMFLWPLFWKCIIRFLKFQVKISCGILFIGKPNSAKIWADSTQVKHTSVAYWKMRSKRKTELELHKPSNHCVMLRNHVTWNLRE